MDRSLHFTDTKLAATLKKLAIPELTTSAESEVSMF